jgi:hypothetical protein
MQNLNIKIVKKNNLKNNDFKSNKKNNIFKFNNNDNINNNNDKFSS